MIENLETFNPIFMMANSGARGSFKQIRQLAGMRGLMANRRVKSSSARSRPTSWRACRCWSTSSRRWRGKGSCYTALRTADWGYLTRPLVDVAQDVIIGEPDCGTEEHIEMTAFKAGGDPNDDLVGRIAALPVHDERDGCSPSRVRRSVARSSPRSSRRSGRPREGRGRCRAGAPVLKCRAPSGVCQACYGRAMATGALAQIGDAVGIVAAQSIGEPGTQLTMRTFHTGGVAGADITHGLPRVVELFEARKPKGLAKIAERTGSSRSRRPTKR